MFNTREELACLLNMRWSGPVIKPDEEQRARELGLVVVFALDMERTAFRGGIHTDLHVAGGAEVVINSTGVSLTGAGQDLLVLWDPSAYAWTYATTIPHAVFEVQDRNERWCQGIVFSSV